MSDIKREQLGQTPVIVAASHDRFVHACRQLGLNPQTTISGLHSRQLEGLRPTSVVYVFGWSNNPQAPHIVEVLGRSMAKSQKPVPKFYIE